MLNRTVRFDLELEAIAGSMAAIVVYVLDEETFNIVVGVSDKTPGEL